MSVDQKASELLVYLQDKDIQYFFFTVSEIPDMQAYRASISMPSSMKGVFDVDDCKSSVGLETIEEIYKEEA
jgi:hypothetical protein